MRLAIVSLMDTAPWGGSEALWHALAKYSLSRGDKLFVSLYQWDNIPPGVLELQELGAVLHFRKNKNNSGGLPGKILRQFKKRLPAADKDYKSILDFKPDTVFINQGADFDLAVNHRPLYKLLVAHNISYSFICHSHQQYSYIPPATIYPEGKEIFQKAENVFFISRRQQQLTERKLATNLPNAVHTWNPLNLERPGAPLVFPDGDKIQFAIVGILEGAKGQDTAMNVLGMPVWKERSWHLNLYGGGTGRKYLEDLAAFYGIADRVTFHGFVNDIKAVWERNHILLIPSSWEGMPISMLEAMACGRLVIAADVGGISEVIEEDINGFISASPSVGAFGLAVEKAWGKRARWEQLGKDAFEKTSGLFQEKPQEKMYHLLAGQ